MPPNRSFAGTHLAIERIVKTFGRTTAVEEVSLTVDPGRILALLGPSGCGKTTLLKMIAGLIAPDRGEILLDGLDVATEPTHRRDMGMLFQNYALFPHLDVLANVAFGLEMRRLPKAEIRAKAVAALERVRLTAYAKRMPRELSGGQQQRVALARAIAYEPTILLLDEPLAALDKNLREGMQIELRGLCKQLNLTTVLVTHDQEEAMTLADQIAVMRDGRIVQSGSAREVYLAPVSRFVAGFIGTSNFLSATVVGAAGERVRARRTNGDLIEAPAAAGVDTAPGRAVTLAIRPENLRLTAEPLPPGPNQARGTVAQILFRGAQVTVVLRLDDGGEMVATAPATALAAGFGEGTTATAWWPADEARLVRDN